MKQFKASLYTELQKIKTLTDLVEERIHSRRVDGGVDMPYLIFTVQESDEPEYTTGPVYIENRGVMFQLWGLDPDLLKDAMEAIEHRLTTKMFHFGINQKVIAAWRFSDDCFQEPEKSEAGDTVHQAVLLIEFRLQRDKDNLHT